LRDSLLYGNTVPEGTIANNEKKKTYSTANRKRYRSGR